MFRVDSSRFNNYPAYEFNLEPLDFYQVNNEDLYIVCRAGGSTDDCVQIGSQEYINGCMVQSRPRVVSFASAWKAIQSFVIMTRTTSMT